MREMVLNDASVFAPNAAKDLIANWLQELAKGMASLVCEKAVVATLRMRCHPATTLCSPGYSLFDAMRNLQASDRDSYVFLMQLSQKTPLMLEVSEDVKDRFLGCESVELTPERGDSLVLCAVADWVAVGFPSKPVWDSDRLSIDFKELLSDGEFIEATEYIDNLTRPLHADPICERHRQHIRVGANPAALWVQRQLAFPSLLFAPGVRDNLIKHANLLPKIVTKLVDLEQAAREWTEGPAPGWRTKVTPEGEKVLTNPKLRDARVFESAGGERVLFQWHARVGDGYRIHIRFDSDDRRVEVGYIGPHLPR